MYVWNCWAFPPVAAASSAAEVKGIWIDGTAAVTTDAACLSSRLRRRSSLWLWIEMAIQASAPVSTRPARKTRMLKELGRQWGRPRRHPVSAARQRSWRQPGIKRGREATVKNSADYSFPDPHPLRTPNRRRSSCSQASSQRGPEGSRSAARWFAHRSPADRIFEKNPRRAFRWNTGSVFLEIRKQVALAATVALRSSSSSHRHPCVLVGLRCCMVTHSYPASGLPMHRPRSTAGEAVFASGRSGHHQEGGRPHRGAGGPAGGQASRSG